MFFTCSPYMCSNSTSNTLNVQLHTDTIQSVFLQGEKEEGVREREGVSEGGGERGRG